MANKRIHPMDLWGDDMQAYHAYIERVRFWRRIARDYGPMLLLVAGFGVWYVVVLA